MPAHICVTCGVQYAPSEQPPEHCPICEDERQYVGWGGQQWTTLESMRQSGYGVRFDEEESGLTSLTIDPNQPKVGIGQRAFLVQTPRGNVLWDCISYFDDTALDRVRALGGIQAIAISHPHFYAACVDWSLAFGDAPTYIHAADQEWVMRPDPRVVLWEGETTEPVPGLTLIHLGGHFDGAQVLYWPEGQDGKGAALTGDTIQVVSDRRYVSFMYSYPNYIPLPAEKVREIADRMKAYPFRRIYGAFDGLTVRDGEHAVERSAERYVRRLGGGGLSAE